MAIAVEKNLNNAMLKRKKKKLKKLRIYNILLQQANAYSFKSQAREIIKNLQKQEVSVRSAQKFGKTNSKSSKTNHGNRKEVPTRFVSTIFPYDFFTYPSTK